MSNLRWVQFDLESGEEQEIMDHGPFRRIGSWIKRPSVCLVRSRLIDKVT